MKLLKPLFVALALMMVVAALPARAVEVPEKVVGADTMLMFWFDIEQVDEKMIDEFKTQIKEALANPMLQQQQAGLPLGEVNEAIEMITTFRNSFIDAGGQGLLMTVGMPGGESWSPPVSFLAKSKANFDGKAMDALLRKVSKDEVGAEFKDVVDGWKQMTIIPLTEKAKEDSKEMVQGLPETPDAKAHAAFVAQMGLAEKPLMGMAFRMQDVMRQEMAKAAGQQGAPADPGLAMVMGMVQPLQGLDTIGMALTYKDGKQQIDAQMSFLEAQNAQQFAQLYNGMMMMLPAMVVPQLQGIPNAPDPNVINQMFMKLQMKVNEKSLNLTLDQEFMDLVDKLKPMLENFAQPPAGFEEDAAGEGNI